MLDKKDGQKVVKISNLRYENVIHRVDSCSNKDSKKLFFYGGLNFRVKKAGKFGKNCQKTGRSIVMQIRERSISIEDTGLYSLASKSLYCFHFLTR